MKRFEAVTPAARLRALVVTEPNKTCVPEVTIWSPFEELELPYECRRQPPAVVHFVRR